MKKSQHHLSFIGAGNVAWHLVQKFETAGHTVHEIYSRNIAKAKALANQLSLVEPVDRLNFQESKARIFFIAVSDDAIDEVVSKLTLPPDALLVHTSGSQPMSSLIQEGTTRVGVFYPLQTFSKGKPIDFSHIPICVEAAHPKDLDLLQQLAGSISQDVRVMNSEERVVLHVAAVFACNFTNYLLGIAEKILAEHQIGLDVLQPLITETLQKALEIGPQKAQTGPAARGDMATIQRHLEFLKNHEDYATIYDLFSRHIAENT